MTESIVTRVDNGKTVTIRVGEKLAVQLQELPTAGFVWVAANHEEALVLIDSDYTPPSTGVGGGGLRTFSFMAKKAGVASLRFKLWREWEGESSVTEFFSITTRVEAR